MSVKHDVLYLLLLLVLIGEGRFTLKQHSEEFAVEARLNKVVRNPALKPINAKKKQLIKQKLITWFVNKAKNWT
jgi:hypothetical protein